MNSWPQDKIGHRKSEYDFMESLTFEVFKTQNVYKQYLTGYCKEDFLDEIRKEIKINKELVNKENVNSASYEIIWLTDDVVIHIYKDNSDHSHTLNVLSRSQQANDDVMTLFKKYLKKKKRNAIHFLEIRHEAFTLTPLEVDSTFKPLIEENYSSETVEKFKYIAEEIKVEEPNGKLVLLDGPPGTGKTYLIRSLIYRVMNDCAVVIIPPHLTTKISDPEFFSLFLNESRDRPLMLVIEDADACLAPRGSDNISTVSSMLNYTDGILGNVLDMRIVASTNAVYQDLEGALLRPGRLLGRFNIEAMDFAASQVIYNRLTDNGSYRFKPGNKYTLADVYQKAKNKNAKLADTESKPGFGFE